MYKNIELNRSRSEGRGVSFDNEPSRTRRDLKKEIELTKKLHEEIQREMKRSVAEVSKKHNIEHSPTLAKM